MEWEKPTFELVDMNAEVGGYQPDFDDEPAERCAAERDANREEAREAG
jgi:hypothetical protein